MYSDLLGIDKIQDVFKSLYDSGRLLESADRDGKRVLRDILHFIKESFGETDHEQGAFQRPHFRVRDLELMTCTILTEADIEMVARKAEQH
jgi:hypothetical protein